jgi:hypothetical protein
VVNVALVVVVEKFVARRSPVTSRPSRVAAPAHVATPARDASPHRSQPRAPASLIASQSSRRRVHVAPISSRRTIRSSRRTSQPQSRRDPLKAAGPTSRRDPSSRRQPPSLAAPRSCFLVHVAEFTSPRLVHVAGEFAESGVGGVHWFDQLRRDAPVDQWKKQMYPKTF